ncbi:MAG: hypothetical protein FWH19_03125 [Treponema sp.]|nr:hypothetical protein [Treponema sp.]
MNVFCLLWVPLFYLFWRSVGESEAAAGGVWALILGSLAAFTQFFIGPLVEPGGFGFSRWLSGCIDIVALPVMIPIIVYFILTALNIITGSISFANFALVWLLPGAVIKALTWTSLNDPIYLVLVPVLWTTIAVGVHFFIGFLQKNQWYMIILPFLGILAIPLAAASSYWAFFSHRSGLGFLLLLIAAAPMLVSVVLSYRDSA